MNDGSCFWYGSQDHFIKDCLEMTDKEKFQGTRPSGTNSKGMLQKNVGTETSSKNVTRDTTVRFKARALAKTYAICVCEYASSLDVITGTFSLYDNTIIASIDPGSTYSYVSMKLVSSTNMPVESTEFMIKVLNLLGKHVIVDKVCEPGNLPIVISLMFAQKCLRKGCEAYLAFVMNTKESKLKVESVLVVSEYVDVFPDELSKLPPIREVEFGIVLIPGTTPILISLYQMTPIELKELKS
ncbi:uncharacterized protein [Gossypium hirsutum]|uniref:Uncharacterized protein n=1 Tax=Gossypium hirsutum TaxID=3635 RepID=A0A1U8I1B1_GOSHI|nr:uncharacterized protein LOC107889972 [Gossypium hirsutum]